MLVVGAAGVFGSRLVRRLLEATPFAVVAAGRSQARLDALPAHPRLTRLALDAQTATAADLAGCGAFAVVDAAGPYQGASYQLARAAIAAGLHFIDLADARDYVAGFAALDAAAKQAGVVALTGASTTPALSNAALDALTQGWSGVEDVEVAISPGNRAPRGLSVMRSILSYAGRPVRVFDGGMWGVRPGWGMTVRREMPGLGRRTLSLSETPDLDIVPQRFAVRRSAVFRAGLELGVLHWGLLLASLPVRGGWLTSLAPLARPFRLLAVLFAPFGTDRGGMTVLATGTDGAGRPVRGEWSLVAEDGDGPSVPALPALAALRRIAAGAVPPGARVCAGVLTLSQIEAEFAGLRITSRSEVTRPPASLYQRVLGARFAELPQAVQRMHQPGWGLRARGLARVEGPDTGVARIVARLFGFPPPAESVEVTVSFTPRDAREHWLRQFGRRRFRSELSASARPGRVRERFGPFSFDLDLRTDRGGVTGMPIRGWRLGPLRLPRFLAPISSASESVDEAGRFCFDVALRLPLRMGRVVRYRGWLTPL